MSWVSSAFSLQAGMRQMGGREPQIPQDVLFPLRQSPNRWTGDSLHDSHTTEGWGMQLSWNIVRDKPEGEGRAPNPAPSHGELWAARPGVGLSVPGGYKTCSFCFLF